MATLFTISVPTKQPRNHFAVAAKQRRGGFMKSRNAPRGGQRNEQRDLLDEYLSDEDEAQAADKAEQDVLDAQENLK